jgi:hypothetical protein
VRWRQADTFRGTAVIPGLKRIPVKHPQPDLYSERVIFLAWRFISLPFVAAVLRP